MSSEPLKLEIVYRDPKTLKPYKNNAKIHSDSQIEAIQKSITEFGFVNPVLLDGKKGIIAGHGRNLAAIGLDYPEVPTIDLSHLNADQKRAYCLADNRLGEIGVSYDNKKLKLELQALHKKGADISLTGFTQKDLGQLVKGLDPHPASDWENEYNLDASDLGSEIDDLSDSNYSRKIEPPTYEPQSEFPPPVAELYNNTKATALIESISRTSLPADIKGFLVAAAGRHVEFNYKEIAEYYSHASTEVQELFEQSTLIIIDLDSAIEQGHVIMSDNLRKIAGIDIGEK